MSQIPQEFEADIRGLLSPLQASQVLDDIKSAVPIVSFRTHPGKANLLPEYTERVPWFQDGAAYINGHRPIFIADPLWHQGAYYVQEAAGLILAHFLEDERPSIILDLCAAPGGKSTLLRDCFPPTFEMTEPLLICNEPIADRAIVLRENILRHGGDNTIVLSSWPDQLVKSGLVADIILVDAPCSGEGMFRKHPETIQEWSLSNVQHCIQRQRDILSSAWEMLEEGGLLIYSTCTLNRHENEEQLEWLKEHYDCKQIILPPQFDKYAILAEGVYRFMPGITPSEGLTLFAVRKLSSITSHKIKKQRRDSKRATPVPVPDTLTALPDEITVYGGIHCLLGKKGRQVVSQLEDQKGIQILSAGLPLGVLKGRDFIPIQGWANSTTFAQEIPYNREEIEASTALSLLRNEAPFIPTAERGYNLLTYRGLPLTFVKQIGNRINNLYPKGWAIKNPRISLKDIPHLPIYTLNEV